MPPSPWMAFGESWFARHQQKLLALLNGPGRRVARRLLAISAAECPLSQRILAIGPNRYVVASPKPGLLRACFRTHPKYAKRVYFAFRPLWWAMHGWDWALADRWTWAQELSFGLSTLTTYPDPHPEVTTVDGVVAIGAVSWVFSSLVNAGGNYAQDASTIESAYLASDNSSFNYFQALTRLVFLFDTSSIAGGTVNSATLSLYGSSVQTGLGETTLHIVSSNPLSNTALQAGDYVRAKGMTSFASVAPAAWVNGGYNNFALNASGVANINASGISKFAARIGWDLVASFGGGWSAGQQSGYNVYLSDQTGTSSDPKLVVDYQGFAYKTASDAAALAVAETCAILSASSRSDIASFTASEAAVLRSFLQRTDAATLQVAETASVLKTGIAFLTSQDTATLQSAETASVLKYDVLRELSCSDTATLTTAEVASLVNLLSCADPATIAVAEVVRLVRLRLPPPSNAAIRVGPWLKPGE